MIRLTFQQRAGAAWGALASVAACALGAVALLCSGTAVAGAAVELAQDGSRLVVKNAFYEATLAPDRGGRIVSFVFRGVQMTRLRPDGHGGMVEEVHSADFPFRVLERTNSQDGLSVVLAAEVGELRVVKQFQFFADRPWFTVTLQFQNRSRFRLSGRHAPALRNLVLPGGARGRPLYCLDRGLGAEILSPEVFLSRLHGESGGPLRWMAVADPAARRAFGFAVLDGPCRPLRPLRWEGSEVVFGWRYPAVPAGQTLTARLLMVPLDGFGAVAELNGSFAAESLREPSADPLRIRLDLMPLGEPLREVSVITRTYDATGTELEPCDALLFGEMELLKRQTGRIGWSGREAPPTWLVHEVYSRGRRIGLFAVPTSGSAGPPPITARPPEPAELDPLPGERTLPPGALIPPTQAQNERGFQFWAFDGAPVRAETERLGLVVARGEKKTTFLGVRALRPLQGLRLTLAGADMPGPDPLPPAAVYLWMVRESAQGDAYLAALPEMSLDAGQAAWLALTVDATQLEAGRYAARLVVSAEGVAAEVPMDLQVLRVTVPGPENFGLWHIAGAAGEPLTEQAVGRLVDYGASAVTAPLDGLAGASPGEVAAWPAASRRLTLLSFMAAGGARPPAAAFPGLLLLPHPAPVWLLHAGGASATKARAASECGYAPALLCERLSSIPPGLRAPGVQFPFYLVADGCEPGRLPQLVQTGEMRGSESVWLYLDLREADWRQAVTEVRSAFWAAAWQGLAGAAVRCPLPSRAVDRQWVIWHILRDARLEVALWRREHAAAVAARRRGRARAAALRRISLLELLVGTAEGSDLRLRKRRDPFRELYGVAPPGRESALRLSQFAAARRKLLDWAWRSPFGEARQSEGTYWRGIPLAEGGATRWAIVASDGEAVWKQAVAFQRALQERAGTAVPVSRTFPPAGTEGALLVWVIADEEGRGALPEEVQAGLP
ncbi:MAG: hypothetical protein ACYS1C_00645, partial [Planctomycetota bacterium]